MSESQRTPTANELSRRERQIMDVIYAAGEATVAVVLSALPDAPGYSAVRALLRILEEKGHLTHRSDRGRYVYAPRHPRSRAGRLAMRRVMRTFFDNSASKAVAALFDVADVKISDAEMGRITQIIERARQKGGNS